MYCVDFGCLLYCYLSLVTCFLFCLYDVYNHILSAFFVSLFVHSLYIPFLSIYLSLTLTSQKKALKAASRGGGWTPDLLLVCSSITVTPWVLQMMLMFPSPIFNLFAFVVGIPMPNVISPGLLDHCEGRSSATKDYLSELLKNGNKYGANMKVCNYLYDVISQMEGNAKENAITANAKKMKLDLNQPRNNKVFLECKAIIGKSNSQAELIYWIVRAITVFSLLVMFYFVVIH